MTKYDLSPTLRAEDLVNEWAYFPTHRAQIEVQIREKEEAVNLV